MMASAAVSRGFGFGWLLFFEPFLDACLHAVVTTLGVMTSALFTMLLSLFWVACVLVRLQSQWLVVRLSGIELYRKLRKCGIACLVSSWQEVPCLRQA